MHRVSIKVEKFAGTRMIPRTNTPEEKFTPELVLSVQADDVLAALEKAIRLLTSERDATIRYKIVDKKRLHEEEDDEEDEELEA